eukprot:TRINITY_DN4626_c0_g1_i1.p1 TRINITY_DN4626_c0_g1~~TRINITY_DN4626_c0_g1_i1.p1  ORF type:complete len:362 (-),score=37.93 TRINITY_DN4626_c0_g1_i1:85-1044(-)
MGSAEAKDFGVLMPVRMSDYLLETLERKFKVYRLWEAKEPKSFLAEHGASVRAVVCSPIAVVSPEIFDSLSCLEVLCTSSVGLDHVDLKKCRQRNIKVANTPDVVTDDVADLAIALMLCTLRQLHVADRYVKQGLWATNGNFKLTSKLSGKTIGIVGLGRIGLAIAKRGEAFGCKIAYNSRSKKTDLPYLYYSSIHELAKESDIFVVACPLSAETWHIIDRSVLDALGPKSVLVNIGRGSLIDETELVKALLEGRLAGAGLDVFENEPHVPQELFNLDNVVLVPHVGTATWETAKEMADLVVGNLEAYSSNKSLLTPVD